MDTATLEQWIDQGRDYAAGVALYAAHGPSATLRALFAQGATSYSRQVLERELRALAARPAVVPAPAQEAPPAAVGAQPASTPPAAPSPALEAKRRELRQAYDARTRLHSQLTAPRLPRKTRGEMAFQILDLTDLIESLKADVAHLEAHGTLPAATQEPLDPKQRLLNLRSQRSKLRKRPDRADDLAQVEAEIAQLESVLPTRKRDN